jgi:tetratricopeptide (TPR) repeat protein
MPQSETTVSWTGTEPDDPWMLAAKVTPLEEDKQFSVAEPEPVFAEPNPITQSSGFSWANTEPDQLWAPALKVADPVAPAPPVLSTNEQFQVYLKAGQQAEAEEWLSRLVTAQPDHAEARELFGSLLEAKGDTAGAALQYSRALELLLLHPNGASLAQPASLYAKVKELAPASPLIAKWAEMFSPKPRVSIPAVETPVSAPLAEETNPETHYTLGVAYKNMGLLDEAKEEFHLSMKGAVFFLDSCLMIALCLKEQGEGRSASAQLELLLKDPKCLGTKAQAIRYELGLLYEAQEQWSRAAEIYESIPTFHDVPQRLESSRARRASDQPTTVFRYGS